MIRKESCWRHLLPMTARKLGTTLRVDRTSQKNGGSTRCVRDVDVDIWAGVDPADVISVGILDTSRWIVPN
jgi:hypothetical protein